MLFMLKSSGFFHQLMTFSPCGTSALPQECVVASKVMLWPMLASEGFYWSSSCPGEGGGL